ncbi:MAG: ArnT family glycosyltransferase [Candidatus Limnocylindria bacterium]
MQLAVVAVAVAVAVAAWLRLTPLFAGFPFGDGGMFWIMAAELRANGFVPPDVTSYNSGDIPWVYPPLGLYLVALLGGDLALFRILPALWAIATIPAVWLLARALIGDRGALVATIAYGLCASAYVGLIAGGGVTRGPGLLLAVLTMWAVVTARVAGAGVLGGLTLLTHPIAAFYTVLAAGTLWATRGASPRMLVAPLIALAIGAAWFGPMIARHGIDPFLTGAGSRDLDLVDNLVVLVADAINPPNLAFSIGFVGAVVAAFRRRWDLLAWLAITALGVAVIDRWVVIPLAILAGLAVDTALAEPWRRRSVALLAVAAVTAVTGVALVRPPDTLTADERGVMQWAATETPQDATFAVIGYSADLGMVEWFPALSGRENVTTWQGSEWVPDGYRRREATELTRCRSIECLPEADYYVLRPDCCPEIEAQLLMVRSGVFRQEDR